MIFMSSFVWLYKNNYYFCVVASESLEYIHVFTYLWPRSTIDH